MVVTFVARIGIYTHTRLHTRGYLQAFVNDEHAIRSDKRGIFLEALPIGLRRTIDIKMVGIGGGDYRHIGA